MNYPLTTPSLREKVTGAVEGGALGDAIGLPWEVQKMGPIDAELEKTLFHPIRLNKRVGDSKKNGPFEGDINASGYISDDTILTLAGLQSLINTTRLDIDDLFNEHIKFIHRYGTRWFGDGVRDALKRIEAGTPPLEAGGLSRGNGVLMKQFPYALSMYINPTHPPVGDQLISDIASCTHPAPVSRIISILHNRMLIYLLGQPSSESIRREAILGQLYLIAKKYEEGDMSAGGKRDADALYPASEIIKKLHIQYLAVKAGRPYTLQQILDTYTVTGNKTTLNNKPIKYSFHVASTFGYVYSIFLQKQNWDGLLDAIRIGEDTDTQASIIGNMIGAYKGEFYDKSLLDNLQNKEEIASLLRQVEEKLL